MNIKRQAFTLVELIVVITILAILGTIAFLSLSGYSKDSRNSVRFNDLKLIESSLELYSQKTGFYPESTLPVTITFANAEAWTQGTFGEDTFGSVGKLDHLPLDPLTGTEYTYSLLNTKGEYELAAALEGIVANNDTKLINKTYAGTLEGTSLVLGTYNGNMLSVSTGGLDYVLAVPTIISGDITLLSVDEISFYNKMAYNGSSVLAGSYKNTEFDTSKVFDYGLTAGELMIFTGSIDDLKFDESKRVLLLENLQKAYSGTIIASNKNYTVITEENINSNTPTNSAKVLARNIIENSLDINVIGGESTDYTGNCLLSLDSGDVSTLNTFFNGTSYSGDIDYWCNLTLINAWNAGLTGSLPIEIGELLNLKELNISNNPITGSIPVELSTLPNLEKLILNLNNLTGGIPTELGNILTLVELRLMGNSSLGGVIPVNLSKLSNLKQLHLDASNLTGIIPIGLGKLSKLTGLHLGSNNLTGTIPLELGKLSNLTYLNLGANNLTGIIPSGLGTLPSLIRLYLHDNAFNKIGDGFISNSNLRDLFLSNTSLGNLSNDFSIMTPISRTEVGISDTGKTIQIDVAGFVITISEI